MILFSRYLASHLQTEPEERTVAAEQGVPFELKVRVKNTGRVPVGRFAIKTVSGRAGKKKKYRNMTFTGADTGMAIRCGGSTGIRLQGQERCVWRREYRESPSLL